MVATRQRTGCAGSGPRRGSHRPACLGQRVRWAAQLGDEATRPRAALLVVLAMILAVVAWGSARPLAAFAPAPRVGPLLRLDLERGFRLVLIELAAVFTSHADYAGFSTKGEAAPVWFWVLGIVVLLFATVAWPGRLKDSPNPSPLAPH